MDDLISRQAAIDMLDEQIELCNKALSAFDISLKDEYAVKVEKASLKAYKEQLENLPSAQPETHDKRTETHECDLINRQQAIDAMCNACSDWCDEGVCKKVSAIQKLPSAQPDFDEWCTDCKEYDDKRHCCPRWNRVIRQALKDAQPERKKGKWITVSGRFGNEVECNKCHSVFWYWMGNYRFCPSCGADMRGESDETD